MTLTAALADLYSLPEHDVARWPQPVQDVLFRNAIHRGWMTADIKEST